MSSPRIEKMLLWLTLTTLFLSIQITLVPNILDTQSAFFEYADLTLYAFDFLVPTLALFFILKHNKYILSNISRLFHGEHSATPYRAGFALLSVIFISVYISDYHLLSLRQASIFFWGILLMTVISLVRLFPVEQYENCSAVPRGTNNTYKESVYQFIVFFAFVNGFIGLIQFFTGQSLGLSWLGESQLLVDGENVATVWFGGVEFLRAYGLFLHPNILAAFLGVAIILSFVRYSSIVPRRTIGNFCISKVWLITTLVFFLSLTFSKGTIVALFLGGLFVYYTKRQEEVPRGTLMEDNKKKFPVEHILLVIATIVLFFLVSIQIQKSFTERELLLVQYSALFNQSFLGNGIGTYMLSVQDTLVASGNEWMFQPVHSAYLILYYEVGLVGLLFFVGLVICVTFPSKKEMFPVEQVKDTRKLSLAAGVGSYIFLLAFFDHYLVTLPQGVFLFWLAMAIATLDDSDE